MNVNMKIKTVTNIHLPKCPYCQKEQDPYFDETGLVPLETGVKTCKDCGGLYKYHVSPILVYTTFEVA